MKNGKATGPDDLPAETLKSLDAHNIDIITTLCNIIYDTGYIPKEMKQSIFVPIPKKPKAQNCNEYRTMCHVTKLLLKIVHVRITTKINKEVSEFQIGFRCGMGMREGIFNLRSIGKRALEVGKEVCICFIDYIKASDQVKHSKMIECLKEIGVDDTKLKTTTKSYWEQSAVVRTESGLTAECKIKKESNNDVSFHPAYFNIYTEKIFKEVQDMRGVTIGGINLNNLRYADDTSLLCFCLTDLQELLNAVNNAGKPYRMEMNIIKTKARVISKTTPNTQNQHYT